MSVLLNEDIDPDPSNLSRQRAAGAAAPGDNSISTTHDESMTQSSCAEDIASVLDASTLDGKV